MCRLFGLHAGLEPVNATFWLLDSPDSLRQQGRRNPDGTGIGVYDAAGLPRVQKEPIEAPDDTAFARAAREVASTTFVAHVRYASTGAHTVENTHPFVQDGRIFAHNGVVKGLDELDRRLVELGVDDLVRGDTDSERVFALVTAEVRRAGGDVGAGIRTAVSWIGAHLPVLAVNVVLTTATDLWAVRYPETHDLYVLEHGGGTVWEGRTDRIHGLVPALEILPAVVVATEAMDSGPWQPLEAGEMLHVDAALRLTRTTPFDPPAHPLSLADLEPSAAASQQA